MILSKRWLPMILAAISIGVFCIIIYHHHRLTTGDSIYVKLSPLDPRSLIQGDYMALNYELFFINLEAADKDWEINKTSLTRNQRHIYNQARITIWVETDQQGRITKSAFDANDLVHPRPLIVKNPSNYMRSLYPAANSFLFAEGLAQCYQRATYAHLKVNNKGAPILMELVNDDLQSLDCESQAK